MAELERAFEWSWHLQCRQSPELGCMCRSEANMPFAHLVLESSRIRKEGMRKSAIADSTTSYL